ncbi:MAG TPA: TSUP family transporter, partial [Flavisolibacter sp.]|nr:TSUP family transporter [Flavisolibacter sp.]
QLRLLLSHTKPQVTVVAPDIHPSLQRLSEANQSVSLLQREFEPADLSGGLVVVIATGNAIVDERIASLAKNAGLLASVPASPSMGNFMIGQGSLPHATQLSSRTSWYQRNSDQPWKNLASKLVFVFLLMVLGHIIISYLPLPSFEESWQGLRPYFDRQFIFFVLSGFLAQLVDGALSMGYGVTSATCLITFGVNPVAMSAAIHTSEIFTTGISGYSHYKFGNVNKKLFRHLVIPGVLGAVLGAVLLVFLGEKYGKWLMPAIAVYAGFLGLKILVKAFRQPEKVKKVRRIGWLAGAGGFLDSFGGGGWGPIVTSNLIAKGRSPKYTIGSVSLTEFFVTLSSAFTFFLTVGVSHWNIVLGLMLGGSIAAPLAARLAGRLPRRAMMIAVGIMVMIWCGRMVVKSL